jgi:alkanesulfonate monooxygenase SsuD/methylene tetrahydromethanopterin reductase-like flavin-dependent oxidoreductase (luciferase family)
MCFSSVMSETLKIAVTAWIFGTRGLAGEFARQGEIAESLGFHSFWLPESHFGDDRSIPSPLMLLAAVAARTETIGLGSTSYLLPIRHPLQAAEEVAVLDRLSGGRVILGVGRGTQENMFRAFDVDTRDKRKRFKANLESMINAWRGEPVTDGDEPIILAPRPVQTPYPPIWVAAFGPLAVKQAGTLGLPYLASPVETLARLESNYANHRKFALEAGHAPIDVVPIMRTLFISSDRRRLDTVRQALSQGPMHAMRDDLATVDDWAIIGDVVYAREKIAEYRERLGMTHLIARGRIPGVDNDTQIECLEQLAAISHGS